MLGFFLALILGVLAAIAIVYSRVLENTLYALLVSMNSIPKIALAPLFIIWMGTNLSSKVAISMLIALFSIVIDTVLGLRSGSGCAGHDQIHARNAPAGPVEGPVSRSLAAHVRWHESGYLARPCGRHRG
jgi:ABC-type spermidine/putrescine transport system permease subunit II